MSRAAAQPSLEHWQSSTKVTLSVYWHINWHNLYVNKLTYFLPCFWPKMVKYGIVLHLFLLNFYSIRFNLGQLSCWKCLERSPLKIPQFSSLKKVLGTNLCTCLYLNAMQSCLTSSKLWALGSFGQETPYAIATFIWNKLAQKRKWYFWLLKTSSSLCSTCVYMLAASIH